MTVFNERFAWAAMTKCNRNFSSDPFLSVSVYFLTTFLIRFTSNFNTPISIDRRLSPNRLTFGDSLRRSLGPHSQHPSIATQRRNPESRHCGQMSSG